MTLASRAGLDPAAGDDPWLDALLGLHQVCGRLASLLDGAALTAGVSGELRAEAVADEALRAEPIGAEPVGGERTEEGEALDGNSEETPEATPDAAPDAGLDAILGLASLCTTVSLIVAALRGEPIEAEIEAEIGAEPADDAAWSRELLR